MNQKSRAVHGGFTLVELMITIVVMSIVMSAIGAVIVDSQRCWKIIYGRINSDVVTDGYVARKKFDAMMRKASGEKFLTDDNGDWLEFYYYASDASTVPDRYARFYKNENDLNIVYGTLNPKESISTETLCENVSYCKFKQVGLAVQMILTLDNGTQKNTIITSAVTHN